MNEILILYYSRQGSTAAVARQVCRGVEMVPGIQARLRTVAPVAVTTERLSGALAGKPAGVFTSTQTLHGGQESTLLSMMIPLLHHGMYLVGLPFTERGLTDTRAGGTPYGASHVASVSGHGELSQTERELARALGQRVAALAARLQNHA